MSRLISRLCFAVILLGVFCHDAVFAQQPPRSNIDRARGTAAPAPRNAAPPGPAATPSGAISRSTQGIILNDPSSTSVTPKPREKLDMENTIYLDLDYGRVVIELHPELAPKTVARIKELVREGFYDGLTWHRVIEGFMAQTGDPKGDGTGGSGQNLPGEFNSGKHVRGAVSMARSPKGINTADSQFFVVLGDVPHLNGQYTYFGEVVEGMEFVEQIRKGVQQRDGSVPYPDHIIRMQVAADAVKSESVASSKESPKAESKPAKPL